MVLKVTLVIVVGILSAANGRTTPLPKAFLFGFENDRYIKPENSGKPWHDAQKMCRKYNSTLAIVDSPDRQRSFVAALYNFRLNGTGDVWLGATASDYGSGNWRWLDGDKYSGNVKQVQGTDEYSKSYAFLSKSATLVSAYASEPSELYSYICQYNTTTTTVTDVCSNGTGQVALFSGSRCFVQYNDTLSWFNARNNCLEKNGDLASFNDMSILLDIVDPAGSWVGLRHSQWNWQNAVTGVSSHVTFTSWRSNQPNDEKPSCISVDYDDFPNWKDSNCSQLSQYLCQVFNETYTIPIEEPPTDDLSTTPDVRKDASGNGSGYKVNVPLAIGLAVGLGGAAIIAIIVITIVVVVRKHRSSHSIGDSKAGETNASENGRMNPEEEATEINETGNQAQLDDVSTDYATVQESRDLDNESQLESSSTNHGPVYADLGFGQGSS